MQKLLKHFVLAALVFVLLPAGPGWSAPAYPVKPIDLIVPWAPGASTDISARLVASYASKKLGQPINVINLPGASGITGMMQALKAKPDGYTFLMEGNVTSSFMFGTPGRIGSGFREKTAKALIFPALIKGFGG